MTRKKTREYSKRERRRLRSQRIIFVAFAVIVIASFVISLVAR
jgi:predicted nucleic acid-binding Zn ribbon protein